MINLKSKFKEVAKQPLIGLDFFENSNEEEKEKNKYIKSYKELTFFEKEIPYKNKKLAKKIIEDMSYVYEALLDLNKALVQYSVYLVGGSVRDLLLGKEIKDLDILICIHNSNFLNPEKILEIFNIDVSTIPEFTPTIDPYGNKHFLSQEQKIYHIILNLLNRYLTVEKGFEPSIDIETNPENYNSKIIQGVIKLKSDKLNYPIDVLLTGASLRNVLNNFDIALCQSAIEVVSEDYSRLGYYSFPETPRALYNKVLLMNPFMEDYLNKTLTINVDTINAQKLISTLNSHLPRMLNKYPEYKYNFKMTPLKELSENDYSDQIYKVKSMAIQEEKQQLVNNWILNKKLTAFSNGLEIKEVQKTKVIKI